MVNWRALENAQMTIKQIPRKRKRSHHVPSEKVDFGSGQGRNVFETTGVGMATSRISKT
jgi:hypothetical protein